MDEKELQKIIRQGKMWGQFVIPLLRRNGWRKSNV